MGSATMKRNLPDISAVYTNPDQQNTELRSPLVGACTCIGGPMLPLVLGHRKKGKPHQAADARCE
jgi:hypothetical protein